MLKGPPQHALAAIKKACVNAAETVGLDIEIRRIEHDFSGRLVTVQLQNSDAVKRLAFRPVHVNGHRIRAVPLPTRTPTSFIIDMRSGTGLRSEDLFHAIAAAFPERQLRIRYKARTSATTKDEWVVRFDQAPGCLRFALHVPMANAGHPGSPGSKQVYFDPVAVKTACPGCLSPETHPVKKCSLFVVLTAAQLGVREDHPQLM